MFECPSAAARPCAWVGGAWRCSGFPGRPPSAPADGAGRLAAPRAAGLAGGEPSSRRPPWRAPRQPLVEASRAKATGTAESSVEASRAKTCVPPAALAALAAPSAVALTLLPCRGLRYLIVARHGGFSVPFVPFEISGVSIASAARHVRRLLE
mmetsp:Transcript_85441/g.275021  ORF Transcript_85441/g.275021 Transcript_85441/m.275021 type:complete len:153 (-) Transcript_85441:10-468(-)